MLHEHEQWLADNRADIAAEIEHGFGQAERGELVDGEEAFRQLRPRHACYPAHRAHDRIEAVTLECSMLYVKDLAQMRKFYGSVLQTPSINTEWTDTWAVFDVGGTKFALHAIPAKHAEGIELSSPPPKYERSPVKLVFAVGDVPAERARLEAMGVATLQRTWQEPGESCDCVDPEGNIFQIAARIRLPHLFGQSPADAS
jgi:predicted enzyme related to lactoylglutathione lyase